MQAVPRLQPARLSVPRARLALTGVYRVRVHFEMSAISASAAGFRGPRGPYLRMLTPELSVDKLNASAICWSAYQNRRKWLWGSRGEEPAGWARILRIFAWLVAFLIVLNYLGYLIAVPSLVFGMLVVEGQKKLVSAAVASVVMLLFMYALFELVLGSTF